MSPKVHVAPSALLLTALFLALAPPTLLAALFLAAFCHEISHCLFLRLFGGRIRELHFTGFGVELRFEGNLSYAGELLTTLAGPAVNLLLALFLGAAGRQREALYLFAGTQAVLGLFNLLPILPLDGGRALWLTAAWISLPDTADAICAATGAVSALILMVCAAAVAIRTRGSFFLLWAALGLLWHTAVEMGLVKRRQKR